MSIFCLDVNQWMRHHSHLTYLSCTDWWQPFQRSSFQRNWIFVISIATWESKNTEIWR